MVRYWIDSVCTPQFRSHKSVRDDGVTCEATYDDLILSKESNSTLRWKVVQDHEPDNPPSAYTGAHGVASSADFDPQMFENIDVTSEDYDHPFGRLLIELWPGDWWAQYSKWVDAIKEHNKRNRKNQIKEPDINEWWTVWGIIILAAKLEMGGVSKLYDKTIKILDELPSIDLSNIMKQYRLNELLRFISHAFYGDDENDEWNPVKTLIDGFNNARSQKVAALYQKLLDEAMSGYSPTTTKYGGLPFLSFILRKPVPLGTEFKVVADTLTGKRD